MTGTREQRALASAASRQLAGLSGQRDIDYRGHMKRTGVAELKAQLSRYLARVKAGEEIIVTERNVPVARLVPVGERGREAALRDLERRGLVRVGSGRLPKGLWRLPRERDPKALVRKSVAEERERGW